MESTIQTKQSNRKPLSDHGSQIHNGYAWVPQETIHIRKLSQPCELRHDDQQGAGYTMVTPGSPRKQSVPPGKTQPGTCATIRDLHRLQDTQWLRLVPPGNNPYPQARLSQAISLCIHERKKKKPWVTPRWEYSSITSGKPKIKENISIK